MKIISRIVMGCMLLVATGCIDFLPRVGDVVYNGPGELREIKINVKGLVCDFCATGLRKSLENMGDVESIDVGRSSTTIRFKKGHGYTVAGLEDELSRRISKTTFTFGGITRTIWK